MIEVRKYFDNHKDPRKLVGAVAGGIVPENVKRYAQKKGLYVVEQNGDNVMIDEPPKGFIAKEW
jgi:hypothetical protein